MEHLQDTILLNNGVRMPGLGLGVYKVDDGQNVYDIVKAAIEHGYRSIDTASFYGNEAGVGRAIKDSGIPRNELFITSKVWNDQQGYESTKQAFQSSLNQLELEYLDLYLIHWPIRDQFQETWRAMESIYRTGKIRAIGVSNFHIHHLKKLKETAKYVPAINQVEFHPHLTQRALRDYCKKEGIQLEAWSPLKRGQLLDEPLINELAKKHGKSAAQIILRWDIQHGVITIPKTTHIGRMKEIADIFHFQLSTEEMAQLDALNCDDRSGSNPEKYDKK
ncbi:aldo/keto reductase [Ornithinibacillus gellani]|uniref:aldo/keto reductase n=1 Tax=Ornithinibacillus gellani TaxID=2293253 RepID=UPI000F46E289|nr:aldo/keto reductase [Ornithinibacillus gellani]TQS76129.1 aldo/keto reductase [Ornithinibacillus gellani]